MSVDRHARSRRLEGRSLYLCTPDRPDLASFVESCIRGGVDVVQLREKELEVRDLIDRAQSVMAVCRGYDVPFILNDRPDVARYLGADGVHVGQDDIPAAFARELLGEDAVIGLSTHGEADLAGALSEPVDYISAGPVTETPTKPGRPGTGLSYLEDVAKATSGPRHDLPFFVTGGVTPATIPELFRHGARRFVVVRYLTESDAPEQAAQEFRDAIARAEDK